LTRPYYGFRKPQFLLDLSRVYADMTLEARTNSQKERLAKVNMQNLTEHISTAKSPSEHFSLAGRMQSFRHAIHGIILMLKSQHNAWLHATASLLVLGIAAFFRISPIEWCWMVVAIMTVWTAEALNTALEFLADVATAEFHPLVKKAKDVAAGAVLISATGSVVIALLILGPHILKCLSFAK